jgi:beta-phosphoglucomutase
LRRNYFIGFLLFTIIFFDYLQKMTIWNFEKSCTIRYMNLPALLIDFDGTLANTESLHRSAIDAFFCQKNLPLPPKKETGKSTVKVFEEWGIEQDKTLLVESLLQEYSFSFLPNFFAAHPEKITWQDDALTFLEWAKDFPQILVTGSYRIWLEALDPFLNIFSKFPLTITKDDVIPFEKPHPKAYLLAMKKIGVLPKNAIAIEDSRSGILSAKAAGCFVIGVKREESIGIEEANQIVYTLIEAKEYLQKSVYLKHTNKE